ncbi:hypothetical protein U0070_013344 [Myodes glareolus]|uniref:Uncharacterized protein n=1 Tax=Myodes glareolus TaxID=447135 RepID=A0AAW0JTA0_MYOGA
MGRCEPSAVCDVDLRRPPSRTTGREWSGDRSREVSEDDRHLGKDTRERKGGTRMSLIVWKCDLQNVDKLNFLRDVTRHCIRAHFCNRL